MRGRRVLHNRYGRLVLTAVAIYGYLYYGRSMEEVARNTCE